MVENITSFGCLKILKNKNSVCVSDGLKGQGKGVIGSKSSFKDKAVGEG